MAYCAVHLRSLNIFSQFLLFLPICDWGTLPPLNLDVARSAWYAVCQKFQISDSFLFHLNSASVPITSRVPIVSWLQYVGKTVSSHGLLTEYWFDDWWSHMWCDDWSYVMWWLVTYVMWWLGLVTYMMWLPVSGLRSLVTCWLKMCLYFSTDFHKSLILFICFSFHKPYQLISALKKRIMIIISAGLMLRVSQ